MPRVSAGPKQWQAMLAATCTTSMIPLRWAVCGTERQLVHENDTQTRKSSRIWGRRNIYESQVQTRGGKDVCMGAIQEAVALTVRGRVNGLSNKNSRAPQRLCLYTATLSSTPPALTFPAKSVKLGWRSIRIDAWRRSILAWPSAHYCTHA